MSFLPETNVTKLQRESVDGSICKTRDQASDQELHELRKTVAKFESELPLLKERWEKEIKRQKQELKEETESKEKLRQVLELKNKELAERIQDLELKNKELAERLNDSRESEKAINKLYTTICDDKNKGIGDLKKRIQDLELKNKELTERFERKNEEVRFYAKRMSEEELKKDALQKEAKKVQDDLKYYSSSLSKKEAECKKSQEELQWYKNSYQQLCEDFNTSAKRMESETEQIKKRLLSRKDNELRKLHEELEDTKKRLASSFERRLRRDQRRVESTGELNPPSAVEEDFKDFLGGERIDAWKKIETMLSPTEEIDVQIRYLACIIFVTAYEQVEEAKEAAYDLFKDVTRQLAFEAPRWSQELCLKRKFKTKDENEDGYSPQFTVELKISVEKKSQDATDVIDGLMHSLKQTAHLCNLECFENDIKQRVWERWEKCRQQDKEKSLLPPLSEQVIPELDDYIKACIRLSWRLVTQVPPLHLEYNSSKFNRNMHNLTSLHFNTENSALHPSENIACYFSPALLERGGRVVCPAEVLCELTDSFSK